MNLHDIYLCHGYIVKVQQIANPEVMQVMASETAAEREKRLAEALRRNLARRKRQARGKPPDSGGRKDDSGGNRDRKPAKFRCVICSLARHGILSA